MKKLLLPLFLLFATNCWAFPTTPVLDTFTRANSTTTLGPNWTVDATHNDNLGILSNRAYNPVGNVNGQDYWNVNTFNGIVEIYFTFNTLGGNGSGAKVEMTTDTSIHNGYEVRVNNPSNNISIERLDADAETILLSVAQVFSAGDSYGFSYNEMTGVLTEWYESGSGAWVALGSVTDTTYKNVKYLSINIGQTAARLSNFGGGSLPMVDINNACINKANIN